MGSVNIAELKNQLSAYVKRVQGGEQIIVCERGQPVARLMPLPQLSEREARLVAAGLLSVPEKELDVAEFLSQRRPTSILATDAVEAISKDRDEREDSILGR